MGNYRRLPGNPFDCIDLAINIYQEAARLRQQAKGDEAGVAPPATPHLADPSKPESVVTPAKSKPEGKTNKGRNIDGRMLVKLRDDPTSIGWSAQKFACHLGCSKSTVVESKTWKGTLRMMKAQEKCDRRGKRSE